jgi:hypothetical protein
MEQVANTDTMDFMVQTGVYSTWFRMWYCGNEVLGFINAHNFFELRLSKQDPTPWNNCLSYSVHRFFSGFPCLKYSNYLVPNISSQGYSIFTTNQKLE